MPAAEDTTQNAGERTWRWRIVHFLNLSYIATMTFVFKVSLIVLEIGGIISANFQYSHLGTTAYYNFCAISGMIAHVIVIVINILPLTNYFNKIPWHIIETVFDIIWAILFIVAASICTDFARRFVGYDSYGAAAFFGFGCVIILILDAIYHIVKHIRTANRAKARSDANEAANPAPPPRPQIPVY